MLELLTCEYEHMKPDRLAQRLEIPEWKWDHIIIDFVVGLQQTLKKYDEVWVIMDWLTKSLHLISVAVAYTSKRLAQIYIQKIIHLHDVPSSIIFD